MKETNRIKETIETTRNYGKILCLLLTMVISIMAIGILETNADTTQPVLLFSDLTSGPKTGWEGSSTRGAAVTVWGKNFGSDRGNSYITVNGAQLTSDSDYAEWGTTGTSNGIPRGLERTTFWIPSTATDGLGNITVTVNGVTSNPLPFTIRGGNIYFVSITDGDDSFNGRYASNQGGSNGPWRSPRMSLNSNNTVITPGDTVYIRGGTYTQSSVTMDNDGAFLRGRCDYGTQGNPIGIIGYPGEMPLFDFQVFSGTKRGVFSVETGTYDGSYGGCDLGHGADYFTIAKLKVMHGTGAFDLWGVGYRIIGNHLKDNNDPTASGVVMVSTSEDVYIYGNYFEQNGYDMYKHDIYIKTHDARAVGTMVEAEYIYVGWNEFDNWTADLNPTTYTKPSRGGAIELQTESTASANGKRTNNIYIHDNYFHDGDSQALYLTDGSRIIVYNNILSNISSEDGGIRVVNLDNTSLFYNNIFYHIAPPSSPMMELSNSSYSLFPSWKNNIFYAYTGQSYAIVNTPSVFNSNNDLFYGNGSPSGGNYNITNAIIGDPQFTNAGSDFHLRSTSPAIDTGISDVSSVVTTDYDGNPRPMDGDNDGTAEYDIGAYEYTGTYTPPSLQITTTSLSNGTVGLLYSQSLQATGGTPPYTWLIISGTLPDGLSLSSSNGEISGTPTTEGIYNFTIQVTDSDINTDTQALSISVSGASCSYSISPTSESFGSSSGTGSVSVSAPSGCAWTASSNASWITITSGSSGSGNGTVNYSVAANSGTSSRTGTMTIAGKTFTVYQGGVASCSYSISPLSNSFGSSSGTGSVSVSASSGCAWTASSNASWITITSGSSGSGNGTVNYSVAANSNVTSRIVTMTIAGKTFTVFQSSSFGNLTIPEPIGQLSFPYDPTTTPEASTNPAEAMPVGVGDVATGGDFLNIQISLGQFSGPVDIYGAYMLSTDPDNIYILNQDLTFHIFSVEEIVQALTNGAFPVGVEPWMENTIGPIDKPLFNMPTTGLPTGTYYLYLLITPAGGSLDNYYLWETYFEVIGGYYVIP